MDRIEVSNITDVHFTEPRKKRKKRRRISFRKTFLPQVTNSGGLRAHKLAPPNCLQKEKERISTERWCSNINNGWEESENEEQPEANHSFVHCFRFFSANIVQSLLWMCWIYDWRRALFTEIRWKKYQSNEIYSPLFCKFIWRKKIILILTLGSEFQFFISFNVPQHRNSIWISGYRNFDFNFYWNHILLVIFVGHSTEHIKCYTLTINWYSKLFYKLLIHHIHYTRNTNCWYFQYFSIKIENQPLRWNRLCRLTTIIQLACCYRPLNSCCCRHCYYWYCFKGAVAALHGWTYCALTL